MVVIDIVVVVVSNLMLKAKILFFFKASYRPVGPSTHNSGSSVRLLIVVQESSNFKVVIRTI